MIMYKPNEWPNYRRVAPKVGVKTAFYSFKSKN